MTGPPPISPLSPPPPLSLSRARGGGGAPPPPPRRAALASPRVPANRSSLSTFNCHARRNDQDSRRVARARPAFGARRATVQPESDAAGLLRSRDKRRLALGRTSTSARRGPWHRVCVGPRRLRRTTTPGGERHVQTERRHAIGDGGGGRHGRVELRPRDPG